MCTSTGLSAVRILSIINSIKTYTDKVYGIKIAIQLFIIKFVFLIILSTSEK